MGLKDNRNHRHVMVDKVLIPSHPSPPFLLFYSFPSLLSDAFFSFPLSWMPRSNFPIGYSNISLFLSFYSSKSHLCTLDPTQFSSDSDTFYSTTLFLFAFFIPILPFFFLGLWEFTLFWNLVYGNCFK